MYRSQTFGQGCSAKDRVSLTNFCRSFSCLNSNSSLLLLVLASLCFDLTLNAGADLGTL